MGPARKHHRGDVRQLVRRQHCAERIRQFFPYPVLVTALIGLLAAKAATGGFGNLGGLMGGGPAPVAPAAPQPGQPPATAPGGGLLSGLGGLLSQFQQAGHGGLIESWIGSGHNAPTTPGQVTQALGPETVQDLSQKTGLSAQGGRLATLAGTARRHRQADPARAPADARRGLGLALTSIRLAGLRRGARLARRPACGRFSFRAARVCRLSARAPG